VGAHIFILLGCHRPLVLTNSPLNTPSRSQNFTSPLSIPTFATLPYPSVESATVIGKIVRALPTGREPLANTKILLANVIRSENGKPIMAAASEETSPTAVTGEDGSFVFTNVIPGTYGIVIITPIGSFLLQDGKGNDFLFNVQAGMILDLGEIHTTLPY